MRRRTQIHPAKGEHTRDWEDAKIPGLPDGYSAYVVVRLSYTAYPAEEQTYYTPGWAAYAEVEEATIEHVTLTNEQGEEIDGLAFGLDREAIKAAFFAAHDERQLADACLAGHEEADEPDYP